MCCGGSVDADGAKVSTSEYIFHDRDAMQKFQPLSIFSFMMWFCGHGVCVLKSISPLLLGGPLPGFTHLIGTQSAFLCWKQLLELE